MQRRQFLHLATASGFAGVSAGSWLATWPTVEEDHRLGPIYSVIPVVGDGKWISTEPPKTERGYYQPRPFTLNIGIELEGTGAAGPVSASTPVPVEHPEQKIDEVKVETEGCEATLRETAPGAGQLLLSADSIVGGQVVRAIAHYKLTIQKQFFGYEKDQFPAAQKPPREIRESSLQNSPGIQTTDPAVKKLADTLAAGLAHPWDKARAFAKWIPLNIRPQIQPYAGVIGALEKRVGDCQEMSALFVALCRSAGIPARLVWVPNHNWSEFYLADEKGAGHWIPVDTACYRWFGWIGAHELVLQKGDRVHVPEQNKSFRLLEDWLRVTGHKPKARYVAELKPQPDKPGADPGPGARRKDPITGEWKLIGDHPLDHYARR